MRKGQVVQRIVLRIEVASVGQGSTMGTYLVDGHNMGGTQCIVGYHNSYLTIYLRTGRRRRLLAKHRVMFRLGRWLLMGGVDKTDIPASADALIIAYVDDRGVHVVNNWHAKDNAQGENIVTKEGGNDKHATPNIPVGCHDSNHDRKEC